MRKVKQKYKMDKKMGQNFNKIVVTLKKTHTNSRK